MEKLAVVTPRAQNARDSAKSALRPDKPIRDSAKNAPPRQTHTGLREKRSASAKTPQDEAVEKKLSTEIPRALRLRDSAEKHGSTSLRSG